MGKQYASEFKESVLKRILPPSNAYIPEISRETGIPVDTLYTWRTKYRSRSQETGVPREGEKSSLTSEEKLSAILETMALNEVERGEYCRREGLYPEQIEEWEKQSFWASLLLLKERNGGPCPSRPKRSVSWKSCCSGKRKPWRRPPLS